MQYIRVRLTNALSKPPYINCCIVATSDYPGFETATISNFHAATFAAFSPASNVRSLDAFHSDASNSPFHVIESPGATIFGFHRVSPVSSIERRLLVYGTGNFEIVTHGTPISNRHVLHDRLLVCPYFHGFSAL